MSLSSKCTKTKTKKRSEPTSEMECKPFGTILSYCHHVMSDSTPRWLLGQFVSSFKLMTREMRPMK
jgi:hypothetical protein